MNLTIAQYKELYEEMLEVNEENIQGMFFVSTEEELKVLAMQFLINKWKSENYYEEDADYSEDAEDVVLEIRWKGEGLYSFWGLDFTGEYTLAHITEIFDAETNVNHLIFLENEEEIEKRKKELYSSYDSSYIYAVWKPIILKLVDVLYLDEELDINNNKHLFYYIVTEIRELDYYSFYDFLRQCSILESIR